MDSKGIGQGRYATTREAANFARSLPDAFLKCRDLGHDWRMYYQKLSGRLVIRKFFCPSCKTNRKSKINHYGEVVSNSYDYDAGYLNTTGRLAGRSKAALRAESINRTPELDLSADYPELANQLAS